MVAESPEDGWQHGSRDAAECLWFRLRAGGQRILFTGTGAKHYPCETKHYPIVGRRWKNELEENNNIDGTQ